jgi:hypothetical protein
LPDDLFGDGRLELRRADCVLPGRSREPLTAEVDSAVLLLNTPAARLIASGEERLLRLEEVEGLLAANALVVDACRHVVRDKRTVVSLAKRPVLFALARALGEAWPGDVPRDTLVARAFGSKRADESHRARLRVAVGRLRTVLRTLAGVSADGESWSSSALALALGRGQRTVQRTLDSLAAAGKVQSFGRGRARRWMTPPVPGFATTLLLPAPLPIG